VSLVALLLVGAALQAPAQAPLQQATDSTAVVSVVAETRIDVLTREVAAALRCPVCQGQSLQDSPSELAQEMRDVIREQLAAGKTPDEVKQYFVGSYGEWILLEPEASGFNLAVYVLPVLAVLLGAGIVLLAARRWLSGTERALPQEDVEPDPDLAPWEEITPR
jgi:cytochrome c-type biogenesis protein CcmH